jgi:ABC-type microcin C transport system duplicated ATPase subunit YejF
MRKIREILKDADVKRSMAYLAISVTVSVIKAAVDHFRHGD